MTRHGTFLNPMTISSSKLLSPIYTTDELPGGSPQSFRQFHQPGSTNRTSANINSLAAPLISAEEQANTPALQNGTATRVPAAPAPTKTKRRVPGGHAPVAKRVVVDMDSDDEIIWTMKNSGYKDREIQQRLAAEGRTCYHPKTISTRFARQRRAMEAHVDAQLDAHRVEWHVDEDIKLHQAHASATAQVAAEVAATHARLWPYTAEALRGLMPAPRYSARACQERFEAIVGGHAAPAAWPGRAPRQELGIEGHEAPGEAREPGVRERVMNGERAEERHVKDAVVGRATGKPLKRGEAAAEGKEEKARRKREIAALREEAVAKLAVLKETRKVASEARKKANEARKKELEERRAAKNLKEGMGTNANAKAKTPATPKTKMATQATQATKTTKTSGVKVLKAVRGSRIEKCQNNAAAATMIATPSVGIGADPGVNLNAGTSAAVQESTSSI